VTADPRAGPLLLLVLLAASLAVGAVVWRERTPDLALEVVRLPDLVEVGSAEPIVFFVREDESAADVEIVGRNRRRVKTLADDVSLEAGERVHFRWDGTTDDGEPAPAGRYRLRVILPEADRDMVFPRRMDLVRAEAE
jgi:flagellar hook assembly protein FlgD